MNILGIGTVFAGGFGVSAFEACLRRGWQSPAFRDAPSCPGGKCPVYAVDLDTAPDRTLLKKIRRADKLSKMSVLAAALALKDGGPDAPSDSGLGVILATGLGAHETTFGFLDDIIGYGDAAVSPTTFSNSVHNAAASYVSSSLGIRGPTLTVTQFRFSFPEALQLASLWVSQGRCEYVLVGGVDQYGDVLGYVSGKKLRTASDGRIRPFAFTEASQVPGEGAVFLLVGKKDRGYCTVKSIRFGQAPDLSGSDAVIIDADGMQQDESAYRSSLPAGVPVAAYAPLFGTVMTGSGFNVAAGALMLRNQTTYASPVQDNPFGLSLVTETAPTALRSVVCMGLGCHQDRSAIKLDAL